MNHTQAYKLVTYEVVTWIESNPVMWLAGADEPFSAHTNLVAAATVQVGDIAGGARCTAADFVIYIKAVGRNVIHQSAAAGRPWDQSGVGAAVQSGLQIGVWTWD